MKELTRPLRQSLMALLLISACQSPSRAEITADPSDCVLIGAYDHDATSIWRSGDGIVSFAANLDINADGAAHAYRADDPGYYVGNALNTREALDSVCDGVSIFRVDDSLIADVRNCRLLLQEFVRLRDANWRPSNGDYVHWIGVAADPRSTNASGRHGVAPCERDGWLVSQTSKPMNRRLDACDPERYIDSARINAIVLPADAAMVAAGVHVRDLALVRNPRNGKLVGAIVGDTNNSLVGEGTIALAIALSDHAAAPTNYSATAALALAHVEYFVFPGTASQVENITNNEQTEIERRAQDLGRQFHITDRRPCHAP